MQFVKSLLLVIVATVISHLGYCQLVKVVGIADGDSFTVLFSDNHTQRVRLHGIDCPEYAQPFSKVAKQFTASFIFKKQVKLKQVDIDHYGRIIAIVYLEDSTILNERLLQAGLAWHYLRYDNNLNWKAFEDNARKSKLGLWADANEPIAPWLWRKLSLNSFTN